MTSVIIVVTSISIVIITASTLIDNDINRLTLTSPHRTSSQLSGREAIQFAVAATNQNVVGRTSHISRQ